MHTDTIKLRGAPAPLPPSRVSTLLQELVTSGVRRLPEDASEVTTNDMPETLQRLIDIAQRMGQSCSCWRDSAGRFYLFTAELASTMTQQLGAPVLRVDYFQGEEGRLLDSGWWAFDDGGWSRCGD